MCKCTTNAYECKWKVLGVIFCIRIGVVLPRSGDLTEAGPLFARDSGLSSRLHI
jgi:hypothetical protein